MWRRRRDNAPESFQGAVPPGGPETAQGLARRGWRGLLGRRRRNAWRVDRAPASQVAWANVPELTPRAAQAHVDSGLSPLPADERLDNDMPRVYCPRCGQENPEGARFCSHCGLALGRAGTVTAQAARRLHKAICSFQFTIYNFQCAEYHSNYCKLKIVK